MQNKFHFNLLVLMFASSRALQPIIDNRILQASDGAMVLPSFEPEIPEHCQNHNLCDEVPNYPHEYIDRLLENNATVRSALFLMTGGYGDARGCKANKDPVKVEVCPSRMHWVEAKAGRDASGRWYFLVGAQPLCEELCIEPDSPCAHPDKSDSPLTVPKGYKATCKQHVIRTPRAALGKDGALIVIPFPVYAGCCCYITQIVHHFD
ncbi:uncharacterized protein LOC125224749 isoform X2 [Leguminivora glycinivorella]|uniref:uncharacterized protein LOC125224749 isoform X2 n=1 Tax=Leguminivora glycinivorella TaxID=1035111 RepID=UPI00200E0323|nr:uncharacterized protein LOC125224749 isoform X2 [Leguminivora glycinivorella]